MKSKVFTHNGKEILQCAFAGFGSNLFAFSAEVNAVDEWLLTQPLNSVLLVADVTGTPPTPQAIGFMLKSSARTKDYVRKQAVVGLGNDRSIVARLIGSSSGNTLMLFDNLEAASDWVAAD